MIFYSYKSIRCMSYIQPEECVQAQTNSDSDPRDMDLNQTKILGGRDLLSASPEKSRGRSLCIPDIHGIKVTAKYAHRQSPYWVL